MVIRQTILKSAGIAQTRSRDSSRDWSSAEWLLLLGIVALAAAVRFVQIGAQPLWVDEGFSWWDARQSLSNLWNLVPQCDPHPPLYFAALKAWVDGFGDSAGALRALSAFLGIATTVVIILAGREIDSRIGWLAGLMFALSPFEVTYGREARPYALLCFGASVLVLAVLRLARMLRDKHSVSNIAASATAESARASLNNNAIWALFICGGAILLWTNDTSMLTLASLAIVLATLLLFDRNFRPLLKPLLFVAVLIIVLWLPYLPKLIEQANGVMSDFWIPKPTAWYVKDTLRVLISLDSLDAFWWAVTLMLGGVILLWLRGLWREALLLAGLVLLPVAFNYAVSMTIRPIFLSRTLIGITPAVILLMASAAMLIRSTPLRAGAFAMVVATHAFALYLWHADDEGNEPWDRIAKEIVATDPGYRSDAIVLLTANQMALPLSHAMEDLHVSLPLQGAPANFPAPGMKARYPSGKCAPSVLGQDLSAVAQAIAAHRVVYFVTRTNNVYDPGSRIAQLLKSNGFTQTLQETFSPGAIEIHKFVAPFRHGPVSSQSAVHL